MLNNSDKLVEQNIENPEDPCTIIRIGIDLKKISVKHENRRHYLKNIPLHCNDFLISVVKLAINLKIVKLFT